MENLRRQAAPTQPASPQQFDEWWHDLGALDTAAAYRAIWALANQPAAAIRLLKSRLHPASATDEAHLKKYLDDLDSPRFSEREKATRELRHLRWEAASALQRARNAHPSQERRRRLASLLRNLDAPIQPGEILQALRAVEALELMAGPDARQVLKALAGGAPDARLTREAKASLDRLERRDAARRCIYTGQALPTPASGPPARPQRRGLPMIESPSDRGLRYWTWLVSSSAPLREMHEVSEPCERSDVWRLVDAMYLTTGLWLVHLAGTAWLDYQLLRVSGGVVEHGDWTQYGGIDYAWGTVELSWYQDRNPVHEGKFRHGTAGLYHPEGGEFRVWIEFTNLRDPLALVATMAHELGHVHLLGHGRISDEAEDHEPLTDLLTVFLGLGVLTANAVIREHYWHRGAYSGWDMQRRGYLDMPAYGYALARFACSRDEDGSAWVRELRPDVRSAFRQAMRFLEAEAQGPDTSDPSATAG